MNDQPEPNFFGQLLSLEHTEDLYRLRVRAKKKNYLELTKILTDEIEERELQPSGKE